MALLGTKASRVVAKSVNFVSAFGAKSSVHSLSPPFPSEPACAGLRRGPLLGGWPCVSKVWGIVPQRSDFVSSFRLGTAGFWDMEQSDFTQHFQLRCSNPSGVLADTTSLYTREALLPSSSGSALENHSLLPRETDCHVAALAAPRNDPLETCPCPFPVISAQTPFSVRCSSPRFAPCRI